MALAALLPRGIFAEDVEPVPTREKLAVTWKSDLPGFDRASYGVALAKLVAQFERGTKTSLAPGSFESIGIKVQTTNAPGHATPRPLVDALIDLLLKRGFKLETIFLLDLQSRDLRAAGLLPPLSEGGGEYRGVPVKALAEGDHFRPEWFHESPLPPSSGHAVQVRLAHPNDAKTQRREGRRSYLPTPLMLGRVGWINLPVAKDSSSLGVDGAVANASLWNVGNNRRFLDRKSTAPAAAIEILAVPELWERHLFTVLSMERFQYSGGRTFHAAYLASRSVLFLSPNPVAVDAAALDVLRAEREKRGLLPRAKDQLLFQYARSLKLGDIREAKVEPVR